MEEEIQRLCRFFEVVVLTCRRRKVRLLGRKCRPRLRNTFLGWEVQMGKKRVTCPDTTTAHYLMIFGEIGLDEVDIPYDPTATARLLPELEDAFERLKQKLMDPELGHDQQMAMTRRVYARIRRRLRKLTAGAES